MSAIVVPWSCRCGTMQGTLDVARGHGTAIVCHCDGCVRAQNHFGVAATRSEGVAIYQTTPDRFSIAAGAAQLGLARLSPKGAFRWFATCCNTQLGASPKTPMFAFIGLSQTIFADPTPLGTARTHVFVPQPNGAYKHRRAMPMFIALIGRSAVALASGRWRNTPFFDPQSGQPVVAPQVLPKDAGRS